MNIFHTSLWPTLAVFFIGAFAATHGKASPDSSRMQKLNDGYYLLHHLCADESQLPMLFIIKDAPADVEHFADRIGKTAKESIATLDRMKDDDDSLRFDKNPLPQVEQDVRDSIADEKQHQLVFGTKDQEFVRALMVSQIEAANYAVNLTKVLADQENNPRRIKELEHMSSQWTLIRSGAYRFLRD